MEMATLSQSLLDVFADVPDRRKGTRYSLPSILALTTLAMLAGEDSLFGIRHRGPQPGHLPGLELVAPFAYSLDPILAEAGIRSQ